MNNMPNGNNGNRRPNSTNQKNNIQGNRRSAPKQTDAMRRAMSQNYRENAKYNAGRRDAGVYRKAKRSGDGALWFVMIVLVMAIIIGAVLLFKVIFSDNGKNKANIGDGERQTEMTVSETQDQPETNQPETPTGIPDVPDISALTPEFSADLSEYEVYMNPQGEKRDAFLVLVNPKNNLTSDYIPDDLTDVLSTRKDGRSTQQLRLNAAKALEALMIEGKAEGVLKDTTSGGWPLSVTSAYRSYSYQGQLFNSYVANEMKANPSLTREQAEEIVAKYSNRPGSSEHQTGLCVDMHTISAADVRFANESEAKWLAENCYKFGFILRYPADKTDVTGISYEPWHFRYVGRYHATIMHESGMCLEEYSVSLK